MKKYFTCVVLMFIVFILCSGCIDNKSGENAATAKKISPESRMSYKILTDKQLKKIKSLLFETGIHKNKKYNKVYYSGSPWHNTLFDWDLYFESLIQLHFGITVFAKGGIELFLLKQDGRTGFIPRSIPDGDGWEYIENTSANNYERQEPCKPFLAQAVLLIAKYENNYSWAKPLYEKLKKHWQYWASHKDTNKNGLSEWDSAPHSGMDNQLERMGVWGSKYCEGVDLNCYIYREGLALMELAEKFGFSKDTANLSNELKKKKELIQAKMWDEKDGFFYDLNAKTGKMIKVKSESSFIPLWAGVATNEQAEIIIRKHLTSPKEFWLKYPIASYARTEPGFSSKNALAVIGSLLFFRKLLEGYTKDISKINTATVLVFLGSPVWHYGRAFYNESFLLMFVMGAYALALRKEQYFLPGCLLGFGMLMKPPFMIISLPLVALLLAAKKIKASLMLVVPMVLSAAAIIYLNYILFGSPWNSSQPYSTGSFLKGALGLMFSLKHGLIPFAPIALVAIFYWQHFMKENKKESIAIITAFVLYFCLMAFWSDWAGGYCYGPRLIIPVIPFLLIPLVKLDYQGIVKNKILLTLRILTVFINLLGAVQFTRFWDKHSVLSPILSVFHK